MSHDSHRRRCIRHKSLSIFKQNYALASTFQIFLNVSKTEEIENKDNYFKCYYLKRNQKCQQ